MITDPVDWEGCMIPLPRRVTDAPAGASATLVVAVLLIVALVTRLEVEAEGVIPDCCFRRGSVEGIFGGVALSSSMVPTSDRFDPLLDIPLVLLLAEAGWTTTLLFLPWPPPLDDGNAGGPIERLGPPVTIRGIFVGVASDSRVDDEEDDENPVEGWLRDETEGEPEMEGSCEARVRATAAA